MIGSCSLAVTFHLVLILGFPATFLLHGDLKKPPDENFVRLSQHLMNSIFKKIVKQTYIGLHFLPIETSERFNVQCSKWRVKWRIKTINVVKDNNRTNRD